MPEKTSKMDSSDSDDHSKQELCNSFRSVFEDNDTDASLDADELCRKARKRQKSGTKVQEVFSKVREKKQPKRKQ